MELVLSLAHHHIVRLAGGVDGIRGGVIDVLGLALAVGKPAHIVELFFVDTGGLVQLQQRIDVAVGGVVLVAANVEVDVLRYHVAEIDGQRPVAFGLCAVGVHSVEAIDVLARLGLGQALVHAAEQRLFKAGRFAPCSAVIGRELVEIVLVGQLAIGIGEDLAVHQVVQLIALPCLDGNSSVRHALHQLGRLVQVCAAGVALLVLVGIHMLMGNPHRHIVVGEVGGLGEASAIVAGTVDLKRHGGDCAEAGKIPLCPVLDDQILALADTHLDLGNLLVVSIIADGTQIEDIVIAHRGSQVVAADDALEQIGRQLDIHVVNHMCTVGEGQSGQIRLTQTMARSIRITVMHSKVIRTIVTAAGALDTCHTLFIDGKLVLIAAIRLDFSRNIVGNGMAVAPIAVGCSIRTVALRKGVRQPRICVRPCVRSFHPKAALSVQQLAAVLGIVNKSIPVVALKVNDL